MGAWVRYAVISLLPIQSFWAITIVNLVGCFTIGVITNNAQPIWLMIGIGFCGALTTFSAYALDIVKWANEGNMKYILAYIMGMNMGCFIVCWLGIKLGQIIR